MEYINDCGVPKKDKCCCHLRTPYYECPILQECDEIILQECCDEPIKTE